MLKFYCDLCGEEMKDKNFFCELIVRFITTNFTLLPNNQKMPQGKEKHFNLCEKCLRDKMPDYDK